MEDLLKTIVARLAASYREGYRLALLFDYDGTLTPLVEHPSLARLQDRTFRVLRRLGLAPGVNVGIISGRTLDDLQSMIDIPSFYYAGTTGLELDLRGERITHPDAENYRDLIATLVERLTEVTDRYPGAWIENKRLALTLHYRKLHADGHAELTRKTRLAVAKHSPNLRVTDGPLALEVTPNLSWDKGSAVRQILEAIGCPVAVIYAGDEANDSEALATVADLGGFAVAVGASAPDTAQYRVQDCDNLVAMLELLDEAMTQERSVAQVRPRILDRELVPAEPVLRFGGLTS